MALPHNVPAHCILSTWRDDVSILKDGAFGILVTWEMFLMQFDSLLNQLPSFKANSNSGFCGAFSFIRVFSHMSTQFVAYSNYYKGSMTFWKLSEPLKNQLSIPPPQFRSSGSQACSSITLSGLGSGWSLMVSYCLLLPDQTVASQFYYLLSHTKFHLFYYFILFVAISNFLLPYPIF